MVIHLFLIYSTRQIFLVPANQKIPALSVVSVHAAMISTCQIMIGRKRIKIAN